MRHSLAALVLGTTSILGLPAVAGAATGEPGWQIGGAAVFGKYDIDNSSFDDDALGFKAFAQYRFNALVGIEAAWLNTGDFKSDITPGESGGNAKVSADGLSLNLVGYLPWSAEAVDLFARVGYYSFDQDASLDGQDSLQPKAEGLTAGLGAQLAVTDSLSVRIEGDWYSLDDARLWTVNLGLAYHFGTR